MVLGALAYISLERVGDRLLRSHRAPGPVSVSLASGSASGEGADMLANVERLIGSKFGDTLTGNAADNVFVGLAGDDTLDGGGGWDNVKYNFGAGPVTVNLAAHSASGEGADALFNIEAVQGSEASDTLIGDGADNTLTGRGGADSIQGGGGNDGLDGGAGDDRLDGGDGSDSADGGDGSDSCTAETVTNCELAGPPPSSGESLRIGTFNTQFLPEEFADSGCCEEIPDRAAKIAERMLASQYDIIALNEVFTDEPKETLVALLQARYPHYIQQVDDDDWAHQDSGLMLFSRFPFEPLPRDTYAALHVIARNGPGMDWNGVAYIEYANSSIGGCEGFDCWADKGVAFVRVRNPSSRRALGAA